MLDNRLCHICHEELELKLEGFENLKFISSDLQKVDSVVDMYYCLNCKNLVKHVDEKYQGALEKLYANYSLYNGTTMLDQSIRIDKSIVSRSNRLISRINQLGIIPERGKLLDYGSGRGAFALNWAELFPLWEIAAYERNNVAGSSSGIKNISDPEKIPEENDFVSLIHVLEHVIDPGHLLRHLHNFIREGGYLFIQVPNHIKNPYDVVIFDHCSHFSQNSLTDLVAQSGYKIIEKSENWVNKEISILAQKKVSRFPRFYKKIDMSRNPLAYLETVINEFNTRRIKNIGILGATNPAYWISVQTNGANKFFLDENKKSNFDWDINGRKVITTEEVHKDALVFIPFIKEYSAQISERLNENKINNYYLDIW
jgi:2-polyprenyl-3-methyl-5-hydroxy-6-metoxy-1,4-benzoquinol methylase